MLVSATFSNDDVCVSASVELSTQPAPIQPNAPTPHVQCSLPLPVFRATPKIDSSLSEPPTLDGRDVTHAQARTRGGADCNGTAGDPVLAHRVARATGNDDNYTVAR